VQMYVHDKVFCYVIVLLLLHKGTCEILRIIPLHIALEQRNFIHLTPIKLYCVSIELDSTTICSMKQRWKCVNLSAKAHMCVGLLFCRVLCCEDART